MSERNEMQEAIDQCPKWLLERISTQSRNLLMLHRVSRKGVSVQTAQTLLVAMGVLTAKLIFDYAAGEAEQIENRHAQTANKIMGDIEKAAEKDGCKIIVSGAGGGEVGNANAVDLGSDCHGV